MSSDWPAGTGRLILTETDSTNAEALRRLEGLAAPAWILALHQSAPRGRRGRAWEMPEGNFAASLLCRPAGSVAQAALLSFVAALALRDALAALTGQGAALALKWPNDVLLNGGKVAGILLESGGSGGRVDHLVIGIGVNLMAAPAPEAVEPGALRPTSVRAETGSVIAPTELLDALAPAFAAREAAYAAGGFAPIRDAWLARAARVGETITARTSRSSRTGLFRTMDESGALVLDTADGLHAIAAADIYFQDGP